MTRTVRLRACSASCISLSCSFNCFLSCQAHKKGLSAWICTHCMAASHPSLLPQCSGSANMECMRESCMVQMLRWHSNRPFAVT